MRCHLARRACRCRPGMRRAEVASSGEPERRRWHRPSAKPRAPTSGSDSWMAEAYTPRAHEDSSEGAAARAVRGHKDWGAFVTTRTNPLGMFQTAVRQNHRGAAILLLNLPIVQFLIKEYD